MSSKKTIRVLMAEDENGMARSVRGFLDEIGYSILDRAYNGQQAVEMAQNLQPDVILMDIRMPILSGLEATRRLMEIFPTPVVILTSFEEQGMVELASEVGAGAYLVKPASPAEIERAITIAMARFDDMMALRRLNEQLQAALAQVKTLQGLLPMCASCKSIRDDEGYWHEVESYLQNHSEAELTHGICPACASKLYPEFFPKGGKQ